MNTGKREAQNMDEMIDSMNEAKENGLKPGRGQSIYKAASGEYQEEKLKSLITANIEQVAEYATKERVSLRDLEEVQTRSLVYLKACEATGTFPSSLGLARSLGYSDRALRYWRSDHQGEPVAEWLEMFNDTCADILAQSGLKNNANSIMAIFLNKSLYGFHETSEVVLSAKPAQIEQEYSIDEIRARYNVIDDQGEE